MVESILLRFEHRDPGKTIEMELVSKFTCINGRNSGEGKSEFLVELEQGMQLGEIVCNLGDHFAIADAGSINALLQLVDRTVLMIDETITFQTDILTKMRTSRHIFVCITRAMSLHFDYPLKGIYKVCRTKDWFSVIRAETLPLLNHKLYEMGVVVTESREGRSEHQMLTEIGVTHLIAAAGRDEIEKKLRNTKGSILVFADLGAVGRAYRLLQKRCEANKNIRFYNYDSFEHLLCSSSIFRENAYKSRWNSFMFITLERYYEKVLMEITSHTEYQYEHGKPLPKAFSEHWSELLDSDCGKYLKQFADHKEQHYAKNNL